MDVLGKKLVLRHPPGYLLLTCHIVVPINQNLSHCQSSLGRLLFPQQRKLLCPSTKLSPSLSSWCCLHSQISTLVTFPVTLLTPKSRSCLTSRCVHAIKKKMDNHSSREGDQLDILHHCCSIPQERK